MRKFTFVLVSSVLITSCFKEVDKSTLNASCTDSCTIVQGRFLTGSNAPIANVPIRIQSEFKPTLGLGVYSTREIASGKTDNSGNYFFRFSLKSNEYGYQNNMPVHLHFNYDTTKFLTLNQYSYGWGDCICGLIRKDTAITMNYLLVERTRIKVRLENFLPVMGIDNFSVVTYCAAGLNGKGGTSDVAEASSATTEKEIDACGNEQTKIFIRKMKNGIATETDTTVYTPVGRTILIKFSY